MKLFTTTVYALALCCIAACTSPSSAPPTDLDNRTGDVAIGRIIKQHVHTTVITDWVRASFVYEDYSEHTQGLIARTPFEVRSVALNGTKLPLLVSDSLVYGFVSTDRA